MYNIHTSTNKSNKVETRENAVGLRETLKQIARGGNMFFLHFNWSLTRTMWELYSFYCFFKYSCLVFCARRCLLFSTKCTDNRPWRSKNCFSRWSVKIAARQARLKKRRESTKLFMVISFTLLRFLELNRNWHFRW